MISVNVIEDEDLQNVLKKFLSSLLPHKNFDASFFSNVLKSVFKYVHLEELSMEYYILFKILNDLNKIRSLHASYIPSLTRPVLHDVITNSIGDEITNPQLGVKSWLLYEHLDNNLEVETIRQEACTKVYSRCMELFDECMEMAEPSSTILNNLPALKAAFISHVCNQSLNAQARIIQGSYRLGRKEYAGYTDWLDYTSRMVAELNARLNSAEDDNVIALDSFDKASTLLKSLNEMFVPIASYGIPEIDGEDAYNGTPMMRHRFVVVVGNENIGKSMFAKDQAINLILAGNKVLYMCGENAINKMYSELLVNYIYKKYQYFVTPSHIQHLEDCPEHIRKVINLAVAELIDTGSLILRNSYSYDNLYTELVTDYDQFKFDAVIIDHSFALTGGYDGDNGKRNIDKLAEDMRNFRKYYPIYALVLSHPSTAAKDAISKDKTIEYSATKGSTNLSTDADDVFVLRDNETLRKEGLIAVENTKRRDADRINNNIILRKMFEVSHFEYDEQYQAKASSLSVEADAALKSLEEFYNVGSDEFTL
jgi:hypothetical protein